MFEEKSDSESDNETMSGVSKIGILTIATYAASDDTEYAADERQPSLFEILRAPDAPSLSLDYELPREEAQPFFNDNRQQLPSYNNYLKTPNYPVPSQELQVPSVEPWNPNNDPKFYYELPSIITKQETPTNFFPKKYNEDVHDKSKPFANKPKQEISLSPISEDDFLIKQKSLNKVISNLAKSQNRKLIETEKVQNFKHTPQTESINKQSINKKLQVAATGFNHGFNSHESFDNNNDNFNSPLSTSSDLHHSSHDRQHFHTQGHDGPHSYKWGYDTGKGHNRQFRFEERDKTGHVKGHYGFHDKHGKLQMVHYNAHPILGFNVDEAT
ncbi:hypothetical protein FQA39_LY15349 [Lamprigera yunnana]|nr:hypothetical protein FQA39_LY15349 [Lamprigera yunnana]